MSRVKNSEEYKEAGEYQINPHTALPCTQEYMEMASKLKAAGYGLADIAYFLGTSESNLKKWKKENPLAKRALRDGIKLCQSRLVGKGIKSAEGYTSVDRKVVKRYFVKEDGELELIPGSQVVVEEHEKQVPPNDKMLMFLLSCFDRQLGKDDWTSKQYTETKIDKTVTHKLDADSVAAQIDKLSGKHLEPIEGEVTEARFEDASNV